MGFISFFNKFVFSVKCLIKNCFGSLNLKTGNLISSFHDKGNTEATIEYFKKVRANYDKNIPLAFFIDNDSWHKTLAVQESWEQNKITLLFLPPYSPY